MGTFIKLFICVLRLATLVQETWWAWFDKFYKAFCFKHTFVRVIVITHYLSITVPRVHHFIVYMDDIIISGNDGFGISALKGYLMKTFEMKDLGKLTFSWPRNPTQSPRYWYPSTEICWRPVIYGRVSNSRTAETPVEINVKIYQDDGGPLSDVTLY